MRAPSQSPVRPLCREKESTSAAFTLFLQVRAAGPDTIEKNGRRKEREAQAGLGGSDSRKQAPEPGGKDRQRRHRRRPSGGRTVDDRPQYERYRSLHRADRTHPAGRRPYRAAHHAGAPGSGEHAYHCSRGTPPVARYRTGGRRALRSPGGRRRSSVRGQSADKSRQLQRPRRQLRGAVGEVPPKRCRPAHRREPRFALAQDGRTLRRYAGRHGGVGHGVPAHMPAGGFRPGGHLHEVEQHPRHGTRLPDARGRNAPRRDGLSPPPRGDGSGQRTGRTHQIGRRHRGAAGRRRGRHDTRFADRTA